MSNYCKECFERQEEIDHLEQENKDLKEQVDDLVKDLKVQNGIIGKFEQVLEEIKKWATNHNPCDIEAGINCTKEDCFECLNYDIKKITKIIDEALNDK